MAFWRAAFAAMILVPMIRRPRWHVLLAPMTVIFTLMCVSYLTAMALTTAANAIWLQATSPWWVFLFSVLIFKEPPARRDLVPLAFAMLGVGLILAFELGAEVQNRAGVLCGLASGITYACVVVLIRRMRDQNAAWLIGINHIVATLAMLPWVIALGVRPSLAQLAWLAAFGILQMALPYVLISRALRTVGSQEAIAICLIEPVLTPLWVYLAWGEVPAWWTIAGATLILAGLVLRYVVIEILRPVRLGRDRAGQQ
jgi:drug/metabolite transporter (DMT)-like permease